MLVSTAICCEHLCGGQVLGKIRSMVLTHVPTEDIQSACWIVYSNQVCGVFYIKRYHRRRSRHNVVQIHDTIREDRTSLINTTWTGHRMVYDM